MMKLLCAAEAQALDRLAAAEGLDETALIARAGRRAAQIIARRYRPCRAHILCGSGNNGADGLVAARHLLDFGFDVRVFLLGRQRHGQLWSGKTYALDVAQGAAQHESADLIIDALFGSGLSRPLAPELAALARDLTQPIVALDLPSGVRCDDGRVEAAFMAELTIAFVRPHPGHFLLPGRDFCGEVITADIGMPDHLVAAMSASIRLNQRPQFGALPKSIHKYQRGAALILGGDLDGAGRLAARAALRVGAGLVALNLPDRHPIDDLSIITETCPLEESLADRRYRAILVGPGNGVDQRTRDNALKALAHDIDVVLDADALTCFAPDPHVLFAAIKAKREGAVILTPHQGEYRRLFADFGGAAKIDQARQAARQSGAIIVLKGRDSLIASPAGDVIINANAPPDLASAGSGDVLAGLISGLLAQRLYPPFESAAAACYVQGALAQMAGRGLIAADLPDLLPHLLGDDARG